MSLLGILYGTGITQMANFGTRILKYSEVVYKKLYPSRGSDYFQGAEMSRWIKMCHLAGDNAWLERVRRIYRHQNVTSGSASVRLEGELQIATVMDGDILITATQATYILALIRSAANWRPECL